MKKILSLALALMMVLAIVTGATAETAKKYSFAFLPNTQNNTFQSTMPPLAQFSSTTPGYFCRMASNSA